jgi:hypothetical protein
MEGAPMKRAMGLGFLIVALSLLASAQTATKKTVPNKTREQAAPPSANINPTSLDFGDQVTKRHSKAQRVTVTNSGGKPLYINSAVIDGDNKADFEIAHDTCTGATVGAGKSCVIDVVFTPAVNERRRATLIINDSAIDSPQKVTLAGNGINSADVPPRE